MFCRSELKLKRNFKKVCWSEKATFEVSADGRIYYVTKNMKDEEMRVKNLKLSFKSGRVIVGVWTVFCGQEIKPLYVLLVGEKMTAKRYYWVLKTHFYLFYNRMRIKYGKEVIMQEDNAPWHTAEIITKYLANKKANRMLHLLNSLDFNFIENV